ncbi:tape measure protein [Pseudoalteromonas sp. SG45-5]|uniref:tape measure protein n=1 Tax=unclassified Pseudoalteromonas TaxID=194690 RepID=UPI0015F9AD35|nr:MULTISPECIES: tape measure protein [unclassified Pseudoalteromonas]MBB1386569.1 tape measure protein [Pseudoalteromonas sp. SG45-5]MBB1394607.1 tape measure protein [Pseudoalteromonas sp. SG44-4]MBB1447556.1 tape measure protein [Pseudoalteromonas sp. SG41-6]
MADKTLELALRVVAEATGKQNIEQLVQELRNIEQSADAANPAADKLSESLDQTDNSAKKTSQTAGKLANELDGLANQADLIRAFEQSKQKLEQQEIATAAAAQALDQLQTETKNTDKPFVQLARSLEAAEKDLTQMRTELTQQTSKHAALQTALKRSDVDTNNLRAAKRDLAAQFDKSGRSVDKFSNELRKGTTTQRAQAQSLDGIIGKVTALAAAYVGFDRVAQAVSQVFSTGDKFEKLGVQMQALMGGIAGGEKATAWVKEFTKNTPLQLGEVSQAFVKLKAFGLDPMDGTMQAITDQALKLGGGFQEVEGVSLALGQAWAKQKLQGEEILQLVERGIPVWDLLQKSTGKNVQELQQLSTAGKLGRDVIKGLIDEMGRSSVGSAAAQMALFSGQVSNAKDNMAQFYNLIAQSGAMEWLKGQITALNTEFAAMAKDGRLKEWAQQISDAIVGTGKAIQNTATTLYEYREEIATVAKVWLALKVGNYFTSVISGATAAMASLRTYTAAVGTTTVATNAAGIAAAKWSTALKAVGKAGLYAWLITELIDVGLLYKDLLVAEEALRKSKQQSAQQAQLLADELKYLSNSTGLVITNMTELDALIEAGKLIWDEANQQYINVEYQQQKLAEATAKTLAAEKERQAFLNLSLPEALKTIESLEQQATAMDGVTVGVDGFIQSIESARAAIAGAGEQYQGQLAILDALQIKFEEHGAMLERQKVFAGDVEKAYKELGLTSTKALDDTANKLRAAYELMQQSEQPLGIQRQAYLKWAEAAIAAADATDQTVPSSIQAAAAALGLTKELDKLIEKANALKPVTDTNSDAVNRFTRELEQTRDAIKTNQQVMASSTATAEQKAQAQAALTIQQQRLTDQTNDLNRVQQLEVLSLSELQRRQISVTAELERLNDAYQAGALTAQEYNYQKERLGDVLAVVNNLLGDFKGAQDAATASIRAGTQATNDQVKASGFATKSLREQRDELEQISRSASTAASNVSRYNSAAGASVKTIVDYQEKNGNSPYDLDTKAIREEKEKRGYANIQSVQFSKFSGQIDNASSSKALTELYNKINKQLTYLTREQKSTLNAAINAQQQAIKAQSTTQKAVEQVQTYTPSPTPTPSYTPPTNNYTPSNNASNADLNSLTTAVRELITMLKSQQTFTSNTNGKTVRLELVLPGGQSANLLAEFEEQFLQKLEQLSNTQ